MSRGIQTKSLRVMATNIRETTLDPDLETQSIHEYASNIAAYAVADAFDHLASEQEEEDRLAAELARKRREALINFWDTHMDDFYIFPETRFQMHHYAASHGYMGETYSDDEFIQRTTHPENIGKPKGWRMFKSYGGDIGVIH